MIRSIRTIHVVPEKVGDAITLAKQVCAFIKNRTKVQFELMMPVGDKSRGIPVRVAVIKYVVFYALYGLSYVATGADLPLKMEGEYSSNWGNSGGTTVELIKMDSPERAQVKVTMTYVVRGHGSPCAFGTVETVAQLNDGIWKINAPHRLCPSFQISIKPVDGKNRFEGTYTSDRPSSGTIYYAW